MKIRPATNPQAIWKSCDRAFEKRRDWDHLIEEVYDQVLVYRDPRPGRSKSRLNHLFDSTAVSSSLRFAGRLKNDIAPPLQTFFELKTGPAFKRVVTGKDAQQKFEKSLSAISEATSAAIDVPSFDNAMSEMCIDLTAGQGAMLISEGPDPDEPIIFEAIPALDIALVEGRGGKVVEIHYLNKEWTIREIAGRWPNAAKPGARHPLPKDMMDALRGKEDEAEAKRDVLQATAWDPDEKVWRLSVLVKSGDKNEGIALIHENTTRTCPWITPRFYKVPGEVMGRGPAMMALPDVRVANRTVELTLRAASLAILGLWTRTQTLNAGSSVNLSRIAPGSMIPVQSNGGVRGPEIQALDVPRNFDLSSILLNEYRDRIRELLFDKPIPQSKGQTPLSASQIIEHIRMYAEDLAVVYGRLVKEIIVPVVNRSMEILYNLRIIPSEVRIDQLITAVKVVSPLADAQNMKEVQRVVQWLEITGGLLGQEISAMAAKVEDVPAFLADKLGVPVELVRDVSEKKQIEAIVGRLVKQQVDQLMANTGAAAPIEEAA